jgi:hypothetical protein
VKFPVLSSSSCTAFKVKGRRKLSILRELVGDLCDGGTNNDKKTLLDLKQQQHKSQNIRSKDTIKHSAIVSRYVHVWAIN